MLVLTNDSYVFPRVHTHELLKDNFILKDNCVDNYVTLSISYND